MFLFLVPFLGVKIYYARSDINAIPTMKHFLSAIHNRGFGERRIAEEGITS